MTSMRNSVKLIFGGAKSKQTVFKSAAYSYIENGF